MTPCPHCRRPLRPAELKLAVRIGKCSVCSRPRPAWRLYGSRSPVSSNCQASLDSCGGAERGLRGG